MNLWPALAHARLLERLTGQPTSPQGALQRSDEREHFKSAALRDLRNGPRRVRRAAIAAGRSATPPRPLEVYEGDGQLSACRARGPDPVREPTARTQHDRAHREAPRIWAAVSRLGARGAGEARMRGGGDRLTGVAEGSRACWSLRPAQLAPARAHEWRACGKTSSAQNTYSLMGCDSTRSSARKARQLSIIRRRWRSSRSGEPAEAYQTD